LKNIVLIGEVEVSSQKKIFQALNNIKSYNLFHSIYNTFVCDSNYS